MRLHVVQVIPRIVFYIQNDAHSDLTGLSENAHKHLKSAIQIRNTRGSLPILQVI